MLNSLFNNFKKIADSTKMNYPGNILRRGKCIDVALDFADRWREIFSRASRALLIFGAFCLSGAVYSFDSLAEESARDAMRSYSQAMRELERLQQSPFSRMCNQQFPLTSDDSVCRDLHEVACRNTEGSHEAFQKEMKDVVRQAREKAAKAAGFFSYKNGMKIVLQKNGIRLAKGKENEALEELLDLKSDDDANLFAVETKECADAGVAAPEKYRGALIREYAEDLPKFFSDMNSKICQPIKSDTDAQAANPGADAFCKNFPRIKAEAITLFRMSNAAGSAERRREFVSKHLHFTLAKKGEKKEEGEMRAAADFCERFGALRATMARNVANFYIQTISRSKPVVNALVSRYYNTEKKSEVDALFKNTRESILRVVDRLGLPREKAEKIRSQYNEAGYFWQTMPENRFWARSPTLNNLPILNGEILEEEEINNWDAFLDKSLGDFTELNAYYTTRTTNGARVQREQVNMLPGYLLLFEKSPLSFLNTFGHELGHKIGPAVSRTNGHDLSAEWKNLLDCYRDPKSMNLRRGQEDETIADFIGVEVLADEIAKFPKELRRGAIIASQRDNCIFDDERNSRMHFNCAQTHPEPILRINGVVGAHPRIRELMGCQGEQANYKNCGLGR